MEKTFAYSHKTAKFVKVFSLKSFPLYGTSFSSESVQTLYFNKARVCASLGIRPSHMKEVWFQYYVCTTKNLVWGRDYL